MKKVVLAICTVVLLSISTNAFSMGAFPIAQPSASPASTEGKTDWQPSVKSTISGTMYSVYSPSSDVQYSVYPLTTTGWRADSANNVTPVVYSTFWDKFGGLF
ncbi:MAG: hypothetical protein HY795_06035 [Desulfovibrio sp.]|nr:hypothetical protein [Desulfovibrio sp.]MBI4961393.1 hypothetical protein [Desulfovibrio sp.]